MFHKTPTRMDDSSCSVKKSPYMKEWMASADPSKEGYPVKNMIGRSLCFKK